MSWQDGDLGAFLTLKRGHDLPNGSRKAGDIPVVSSSGFTGWHNEAKAEPPGVVTGRYGTIGEVFYVDQPYWPLNTALYVIDFKGNDPRFISYFLRQHLKNYKSEKAAVPGVDRKVLHKLSARCPDLQIQQSIVRILSAYDDLIENNRRRIKLLEESARQLYKEWFVRFRFPGHEHVKIVDGVPEGWERVLFSEMADVLRGRSYTSAELRDEGGRAFVNLKCINRFGGFRDTGVKGIEGDFREKHMVSPGDIVMAVTDMTRDAMIVAQSGRISKTVEADAIFSMDLVKIVPKPEIQRDWLYSLLRFSNFAFDVREHANGTNVLHLKPKHIEEWKGFLPSESVRDWFAESVQPVFDQIDNLQLQSRNAAKARDLLLPRMMNGSLTV